MIRRIKDELTKQKGLNQTLQSELDATRGVNGSEAGSRTRNANGRNTPIGDDENLRSQLAESQRQVQRLNMENTDLHRRLDKLQTDMEQLRDDLVATQRTSEARLQNAEDLEAEVERLESELKHSTNEHDENLIEQLTAQNQTLKEDNKMLSDKINLLLDVDHPSFGADRPLSTLSAGRASHTSSDNAMAYESLTNELDDWRRRLASSASSNRPLSDYDHEPRQQTTERLR